jgi:DNA-binding response OmpR family regulator
VLRVAAPPREPGPDVPSVTADGPEHLLRMTIRNLRLRLDAAAPGEPYISTEYGLGYRLSSPGLSTPGS